MAELTPRARLQPCVLDRLTDHEPETKQESRDRRVVSPARYKSAVLRDLEMLLNSKTQPFGDGIYDFSEAARSVLNYGIPDLCGVIVGSINPAEIESRVKQALLRFEPRILPESLSVRIITQLDAESIRTLSFEIEGQLWAQPVPDHVFVKTEVDLESGHHTLKGESGG